MNDQPPNPPFANQTPPPGAQWPWLTALLFLILGLVLGAAGYRWFIRNSTAVLFSPPPAVEETGTQLPPAVNEVDTSNWQTYRNEEYGFEIKHPTDWEVVSDKKVARGTYDDYNWTVSKDNYELSLLTWPVSLGGEGGVLISKEDATSSFLGPVFISLPLLDSPQAAVRLIWPESPNFAGDPYGFYINFIAQAEDYRLYPSQDIYATSNIRRNNLNYSFVYSLPEGINGNNFSASIINEMDQILATFKFIR